MSILASDYEALRAWLKFVADEGFLGQLVDVSPEAHPVLQLDAIAARSPAKARQGLAMAVSDLVEASAGFTATQVRAADARLAAEGLPTLSSMRVRFWKGVTRALARGRARTEAEYHALRSAAETAERDEMRDRLWALVTEFEERSRPAGA